MPTSKPRVTFTISEQDLKRVDDYRFENKLKNQTQAILDLISKGLDSLDIPVNKKGPALSGEAMQLARDFDALDDFGRRTVRVVADSELARVRAAEPEKKLG